MLHVVSERSRLKIEITLLLGLFLLLVWKASGARGFALLAVSGAVALVILAVARIANNWGTPNCKRWVLAIAAMAVVGLYGFAYAGMLRRGLVVTQVKVSPGGIVALQYESDWAYRWADFEFPGRWQQACRVFFWPAFTTDRLLGIRPGINDGIRRPNQTGDSGWRNVDPPTVQWR